MNFQLLTRIKKIVYFGEIFIGPNEAVKHYIGRDYFDEQQRQLSHACQIARTALTQCIEQHVCIDPNCIQFIIWLILRFIWWIRRMAITNTTAYDSGMENGRVPLWQSDAGAKITILHKKRRGGIQRSSFSFIVAWWLHLSTKKWFPLFTKNALHKKA